MTIARTSYPTERHYHAQHKINKDLRRENAAVVLALGTVTIMTLGALNFACNDDCGSPLTCEVLCTMIKIGIGTTVIFGLPILACAALVSLGDQFKEREDAETLRALQAGHKFFKHCWC